MLANCLLTLSESRGLPLWQDDTRCRKAALTIETGTVEEDAGREMHVL